MNVDILIHECTYWDSSKKLAFEKKHSYFSEVVKFAKDVNAKKLILTHFSSGSTVENLWK
jgi:ribonuclease BN (tRNA processing enzyme)